MTENNPAATPIRAERCARGGHAGVDAMDWFLRAGLALLGFAALWFVVLVFKPLPAGRSQPPPAIPSLVAMQSGAASIGVREQRLASLNSGGNIFASDRNNWPVRLTRTIGADLEAIPDRSSNQEPVVIAAGHQDIDSIELADNAPTAIKIRLDQIKLRGVYVVNGEQAAMIGRKTNASSVSYRVGDTFDDGEWRLVAIDDIHDRVILHRSGLNFELKLYDTGTDTDAPPRTSISAANATGEVAIDFTSLDRVATELREAGLPRDQINELITLAQADPADEQEPDNTDGKNGDDASPATIVPAMPPGMVQLFRAMAEGSRDVVATPPAPKPSGDDKADGAAQGESSEKKEKDS